MPHSMTMFVKITGVDKMALNRIHELLNGNSFMSRMKFIEFKGYCGPGEPMKCVELLDAKLDHGETYTIKLKVVVSIHRYIEGGKEGYFLTPRTMLDQVFQVLEIMPDEETFMELESTSRY